MTKPTGNPPGRPPKHGAYSGSALVPLTREKTDLVIGLMTGTSSAIGPTDRMSVELFARTLAKVELLDRFFSANGLFEELEGSPRPAVKLWVQLMQLALRWCEALGLTPSARIRLGLGVAHTSDLAERMRKAREEGE